MMKKQLNEQEMEKCKYCVHVEGSGIDTNLCVNYFIIKR